MTDLNALKQANAKRWLNAKIVPGRMKEVMAVARRLVAPAAKARYQEIAQYVWGKPWLWFVVAVIHEREASQRWDRQLGQGDPLNQVSHNKPKGRGPFHDHDGHDAFFWGAVDALTNCGPFAAKWTDWSIGGTLTLWVLYNGTGYEDFHHEASPYDWGATDQQQRGKYIADGKFDPGAWDTQVGCAAMLMGMMALDPTITFTGAVITPVVLPDLKGRVTIAPAPSPAPSITNPAKGSIGAFIASIFNAIFKRKS
jgi:lysozyme family protein